MKTNYGLHSQYCITMQNFSLNHIKTEGKGAKRGHLFHLSLLWFFFLILVPCKYHGESPCKYKGGQLRAQLLLDTIFR